MCIEKGVFENTSLFNALTSNNFLAVYQTFSKNIAIKCYENAEKEVNEFKTKQ
ncbi:36430_t:CDS:2, partial [Racocetra persica]